MFPVKTERTVIAPCTMDQIPEIIKMFEEPDSNKFIAPLLHMDHTQWRDKLEKNIKKNEELLQYWVAHHREDNALVGTLNLNKFGNTEYDQLGVHLSRQFWNKGYGFEVCQPILDYGFNHRNLEAIHWIYEKEHDISGKLALKLGFEPYIEITDEEFGDDLFMYRLRR